MPISCKIIGKAQLIPVDLIYPPYPLIHGDKICEIITGQENLVGFDGLFTSNKKFKLGISSADCAAIFFKNSQKFGVIHAGWRGLCGNICENMMQIFQQDQEDFEVFVSPILDNFEIKKDFCHNQILAKFGNKFFENIKKSEKITFNFKAALKSILPENAKFDGRNTLKSPDLYSWRENKTPHRNFMIAGDLIN